jgi:N-acetylglucosamine-6-phosphate deacetylase
MSVHLVNSSAGDLVLGGARTDEPAGRADRTFDASGLTAAPGFIELQINGACGHDLTAEPTEIWTVGEALPRHGVTSFLPTIVSSPPDVVEAARQTLLAGPPAGYRGARALGLHLEGPFISRPGAHRAEHIRAPLRGNDWSPPTGVRMVTLAPELPGALELVRELSAAGVLVAAGHSDATYEQGRAAIDAGIRYGTHLFNVMPLLHHRAPGLAAALLLDRRVTLGLIADGVHVDQAMIALAWRLAGPDRVSLVTDAGAAFGVGPGSYRLGDAEVAVDERAARLPDGTLASSTLTLPRAVRNLAEFSGASIDQALATVTSTPARLLGLAAQADDLTLLDRNLNVVATFIAGEPVHVAEPDRWA